LSVRIFLALTLFVLQISSVAKANRSVSLHFFSEFFQDHQHLDEPQDFHRDSESIHDHEDQHDSDDLVASHEHMHRHFPEDPEHNHSHQHTSGHVPLICLSPAVALQLNLYLNADIEFLRFDDRAIQSPYFRSVFRPPIG